MDTRQAAIDFGSRFPAGVKESDGDLRRVNRPDRRDRAGIRQPGRRTPARAARRKGRGPERRSARGAGPESFLHGCAPAGRPGARRPFLSSRLVPPPLDPGCLKSLVGCLGDPSVGAACGHVYFLGDQEEQAAHMGLYWRYEKWIRLNHTRIHSIQAGTGCIYAMRRELAAPIPPDTLLDDSYLPLCAFFRGYRFVFDTGAIAYEYPTTLDAEFHRKVRTLAGIYQLIGIFPALIGPGNCMWIHFVSHKLGRLLLRSRSF